MNDEADSESKTNDESDSEMQDNELWTQVKSDLIDIVGEEADFQVFNMDDTIEVHVRPKGIETELEDRHDDLSVLVHEGFSVVISSTTHGG